ncbi:TonB-dependent receptor [Flammeovirga sp. EKP202]|uniref:SusC/RagA family TonB-linked outer membrane protein n=1 Tax=Flammeovirga sp. EKP202 TaxID=2770592 RepID=UPI00165EE837|nr:TonB-dependent receptor [Flammeovirga sp. EKP202]MBD0400664.1 TonB-dependent receptor [Flammeovirga sp. EKP202]
MQFSSKLSRALRIFFLLGGLTTSSFAHASGLKEGISTTTSVEKMQLRDYLSKAEKQFNVQFSYSNNVDDAKWISVSEAATFEAMTAQLKAEGYDLKRIGNNIIITPTAKEVQQEVRIKGQVTDKSGESIIGAAVQVKGTNIGSITNLDGEFELLVPSSESVLIVSFVGFITKEVVVGSTTNFSIQLEDNTQELEEVVVIGYGSQSKEEVTGAISSVRSDELQNYAASGLDQQMVGKMAGVLINENNAAPGQDAKITIRGTSSLTAGTNPLIVVDGMPLSEGTSMNDIPPSSIASIDVLKDAASSAIYGSRASNGVILITTKQGYQGKTKVSFDYFTGIQQAASLVDYADAYESAQFFTHARDWGYVSKDPANRSIHDSPDVRAANGASKREYRLHYVDPYLRGEQGLTNTNWNDHLFQNAPISNYSVSLNGGNEKTSFYTNVAYMEQEGIVPTTGMERFTANLNLRTKLSDRVEAGISMNTAYSVIEQGSSIATSNLWIAYPFFDPYNPDGTINIGDQHEANAPEDGALQENPLALLTYTKDVMTRFRTFGNAFASVELLDGLKYKLSAGMDYNGEFTDFYSPNSIGGYRQPFPHKPAEAREINDKYFNYLFEHILTYNKVIGDHNISALAGMTMQREDGTRTRVIGTGMVDDNVDNIGGASSFNVDAYRYTWTQQSLLGRLQYSYKGKYQMALAARADGSSRFGDNSKWGYFPSVSGGWILSKEDFFPEQDVVTFVKLRANWGQTGNNQIGAYGSKALVTQTDYIFGGGLHPGYSATTAPNPNLSWETNDSYNIGFDMQLLKKINLSANYYNSITTDLLLEVPVPEQSGYSTSLQNIGSLRNNGFELELQGYDFHIGGVTIGFNANITTNNNEILSLAPGQEQIITGYNGSFRTRVGGPMAEMIGYDIIGVYKDQGEIDNSAHLQGTLVGDYIVRDVNGDGVIDENDMVSLGTYEPKFHYGFGANLTYKGFDFSFTFNGIQGRKIFDRDMMQSNTGEGFAVPTKDYYDNYYHPEHNPNGHYAQPNMGNFSAARKNTRGSSIDVVSGDYLRLRNVTLGYNLPKSVLQKLNIAGLRVYATANNPLTITSYKGINMDGSNTNNLEQGWITNNPHPIVRSYLLGANLKF